MNLVFLWKFLISLAIGSALFGNATHQQIGFRNALVYLWELLYAVCIYNTTNPEEQTGFNRSG
jgi:hypothetical protein